MHRTPVCRSSVSSSSVSRSPIPREPPPPLHLLSTSPTTSPPPPLHLPSTSFSEHAHWIARSEDAPVDAVRGALYPVISAGEGAHDLAIECATPFSDRTERDIENEAVSTAWARTAAARRPSTRASLPRRNPALAPLGRSRGRGSGARIGGRAAAAASGSAPSAGAPIRRPRRRSRRGGHRRHRPFASDVGAARRTASRRGGAVDADGLVQRLPSPARTKFNLTKLNHLLLTYIACSQQTLGRATTAGSAPNPGNLYGIQPGHAIAAWLRAKPGQPVRHPPRAPRRPLPPQTVLSGERRGPRRSPWREDLVVAPASARPEL